MCQGPFTFTISLVLIVHSCVDPVSPDPSVCLPVTPSSSFKGAYGAITILTPDIHQTQHRRGRGRSEEEGQVRHNTLAENREEEKKYRRIEKGGDSKEGGREEREERRKRREKGHRRTAVVVVMFE